MEKVNVTLREETLHDVIHQLRQYALPILKTIMGAIKNGEWNVEILCADGETIKIQNQKEFVAYLKKVFTSSAQPFDPKGGTEKHEIKIYEPRTMHQLRGGSKSGRRTE